MAVDRLGREVGEEGMMMRMARQVLLMMNVMAIWRVAVMMVVIKLMMMRRITLKKTMLKWTTTWTNKKTIATTIKLGIKNEKRSN